VGQILESLVEAEILHPINADLEAQEGGEFFVPTRHEALAIHPQDGMPMLELLQQAVQLAAPPLVLADPEDRGDLVGGEAEDS